MAWNYRLKMAVVDEGELDKFEMARSQSACPGLKNFENMTFFSFKDSQDLQDTC